MDKNQQLLVAAAVPVGDTARIDDLVMAGVDAILVHSLHGDTKEMVETIKYIKSTHKNTDVIAGNVVTTAQAKNLCEAGADAIRIGMGASSVSMTASVSAVGRPQATAVYNVAKYVQSEFGIPVLADGGCNNSGQVMKALCLGADAVFCGSLLAGSDQAPGSYFYNEGMRVKAFSGLASRARGTGARTGVSGAVVDKGCVLKLVQYIMMGVRHGMQDLGVKSMADLHPALRSGKVRMEIRSNCAQKEGKVHDLHRSGKGIAHAFKASLGMS
jgi:IMP dehydrogenase